MTDADLFIGHLDPDGFLGGAMRLSRAAAEKALAEAGAPVGLDAIGTARGIHDIVNENMAAAARTHIAEKGLDARSFTLVATGGAGPVHAVDVARRLKIRRVLCPIASGVGSCLGFLAAPARAERTWSQPTAPAAEPRRPLGVWPPTRGDGPRDVEPVGNSVVNLRTRRPTCRAASLLAWRVAARPPSRILRVVVEE